MSQHLRVEIMRLEAGVMHMILWPLEEEEAVVVDELLAAAEAVEDGDILSVGGVDELLKSRVSRPYLTHVMKSRELRQS